VSEGDVIEKDVETRGTAFEIISDEAGDVLSLSD